MHPSRVARLTIVVALVALVSSAPSPAFAHAIVETTEPRIDQVVEGPPERVVMRFNEPVELAFGAVRVFDTNGDRVDSGDAQHLDDDPQVVSVPLRTDLPDGTYTVTWRVVSADGHPIAEAFVFHVGAPGERPEGIADEILEGEGGAGRLAGALYGLARWVNFSGLLLLAGAAIFLVAVWRVATNGQGEAAFLARWKSLMRWSWFAVVVATLVAFVTQGAVAGGLPLGDALSPSVLADVGGTRFGRVAIGKLVVLVLAAVLWRLARDELVARPSAGAEGRRGPSSTTVAIGAVILIALLTTPALAGHAAATSPAAVNIVADALHLTAASAWIGGLVVLLAAVFPAVATSSSGAAGSSLGPIVARFSTLALRAVAVVVVTGTYASWIEVKGLSALTGATYGLVLLAKIGVFIPIVILGGINNRIMKPRLERAARVDGLERAGEEGSGSARAFKKIVATEIALAAVVIVLTALLVNLPPARVEAGLDGPFIAEVSLGDADLEVLVDPNEVGANEVHLTATTASGAPLPIKDARVLFTMPSEDIGPLVGKGTKLAPGHFVVQGNQLSVPGKWSLEIVARTGPFDEERATVTVDVNG